MILINLKRELPVEFDEIADVAGNAAVTERAAPADRIGRRDVDERRLFEKSDF